MKVLAMHDSMSMAMIDMSREMRHSSLSFRSCCLEVCCQCSQVVINPLRGKQMRRADAVLVGLPGGVVKVAATMACHEGATLQHHKCYWSVNM